MPAEQTRLAQAVDGLCCRTARPKEEEKENIVVVAVVVRRAESEAHLLGKMREITMRFVAKQSTAARSYSLGGHSPCKPTPYSERQSHDVPYDW